jgi:hypothetical protein
MKIQIQSNFIKLQERFDSERNSELIAESLLRPSRGNSHYTFAA